MHFIVTGARNGGGGGDVLIVLVEGHIGGHDLHVDPERFHIGQTLLWRPGVHGVEEFPFGTGHAMPCSAGQNLSLETLGGEMRMNIDRSHTPPRASWLVVSG